MGWIRTHPYAAALCLAGALLIVGAFIVQSGTPAQLQNSSGAWQGSDAPLINPASYAAPAAPAQERQSIMRQVESSAPYTYAPPAMQGDGGESLPEGQTGSFDFDAFVAELTRGSTSAHTNSSGAGNGLNPYAFIPSGLVSTTTRAAITRSDTQQTLYDYGNEVGSYIETFEEQHRDAAQVLKNQAEDRADSQKAVALEALASGLRGLGQSLLNMDTVPSRAAASHTALAKSYIEIGARLARIPKAERDSDFLAAIQAYDASADTFTKNYVALAQLFGAAGVVFAPEDAGSAFTFTPHSF